MIDTMSSKQPEKPACNGNNHMQCTWCKGEKAAEPCKKCNGTGHFCMNNLDSQMAAARDEIKKLVGSGLKDAFNASKKRNHNQAFTEHKDIICDNCESENIMGVRYKCSECDDYDLCEKCEAKGVHSHHTFLKIRKPQH